jgi:nucleoside-diphosphate-sugar epimerase
VADACFRYSADSPIHVTYFGTGCIYSYDDYHSIEAALDGRNGFTESDPPNFAGSFYSKTKAMTEQVCLFV